MSMRHKRKTFHVPRGFKFALTGLFIALGILVGGAWYWNKHKNEIIKSKIEDAIVGGSQGLYRVSYDSLELDEVAGWLVVQNLHLSYDSLRYASFKAQQLTPPLLLNITIPEIRVSGIQTPRAVLQKEIRGRMMEIKNPIIDIYYTYQGKDSTRNVPTRDVY